jgi:predicted nucleic acid-binding protein
MAGVNYLVDTNIISELAKKKPDSGVESWASTLQQCALSVITVEELFYGLTWRPNSRVSQWLDHFIDNYAEIIPVNEQTARRAGTLRGELQAKGIARTQADLLIASTASEHGLTVVTRNTKDFEGCGVALLDPFGG